MPSGPTVHLVEIRRHTPGWKGTWYRTGQRHFVQQHPAWPKYSSCRWHALTPGTWGGIQESDCRVLRGPLAWLRCQWFRITARNASWSPGEADRASAQQPPETAP